MSVIHWNLGPNEIDCEVTLKLCRGERRVMYDRNGDGYPGSPPTVEIIDAMAILPGGTRRRLTDEEYGWLEEAENEIAEKAERHG